MSDNTEKEDNINSLCKKYFTPELCDEPVTETKHTLELKLWTQLEKYGHKVAQNYSALSSCDREDVIIFTIGECFKNWKKAAPDSLYTVYFGRSLKNNFAKQNKKVQKEIEIEQSFEAPIKDGGISLEDRMKSNDSAIDSKIGLIQEAKKNFKFIDYYFLIRKRADWWKSLITGYLYEDLHQFAELSPETDLNRFSFFDKVVFNFIEPPTQKMIAKYLGKDEGQISLALKTFSEGIKEHINLKKD